jgi:hypothetical protein
LKALPHLRTQAPFANLPQSLNLPEPWWLRQVRNLSRSSSGRNEAGQCRWKNR